MIENRADTDSGLTAAVSTDLSRTTARSALAAILGTGGKLVLRAGSMVVLARLLAPEDFGLLGMVTVLTGLLGLFRDAGLCLATVQREEITREEISTLFWINTLVGVVFAGITAGMAPAMVVFYREPRLFWVTIVVATSFLFYGSAVQHQALLQRRMRFGTLVGIEVLSLAIGVGVSIGMAAFGWGYWALMGMAVGPPIASAVGSWLALPWLPSLPKRRCGIRDLLHIGGAWSLSNLMVYVGLNIEKVLLGRFWGAEALGLYGRAYQLINLPTEQLHSAISPVMVSALARLQNEPERLRLFFMSAYSAAISLTIPITLAGALFAEEITLIVLGPKWLAAAPIFRLLAPVALVFSLINPVAWFLMATARNRRGVGIALLVQVVVIVGILAGLPYGPNQVAAGYSFSLIVVTVPVIAWSTWGSSITLEDILGAISRPFLAALAAGAAGLGLKIVLEEVVSPIPGMVVSLCVAVGLYGWLLLIVMGQKGFYIALFKQLFPSAKRPTFLSSRMHSWQQAGRVIFKRKHTVYRGSVLPRPEMRASMCGPEYIQDEFFLDSAVAEARRLVTRFGCIPGSKVVDIGCGVGRLPIGLIREVGPVHYWGFDVVRPWIRWCRKHIERHHPSFRFVNLDVKNEMYNPYGQDLTEAFRFPLGDGHADIVYLWGLFTNMRPEDMHIYVSEISRILREGGGVFLTAFVESGVPAVSVNPTNYVNYPLEQPLHVVRYEKEFLFLTFAEHGLSVEEFAYHQGVDCNQSEIYLRKAKSHSVQRKTELVPRLLRAEPLNAVFGQSQMPADDRRGESRCS